MNSSRVADATAPTAARGGPRATVGVLLICCLTAAALLDRPTGALSAPRQPQPGVASSTAPEAILFYNANTGSGAIGQVLSGVFTTTATYPNGAFATGWTHITGLPSSGGQVLFYSRATHSGVEGRLSLTAFTGTASFPGGSFGDWSHVVGVSGHEAGTLLFYDDADGSGALGFNPSVRLYPPSAFAPGWTHIVRGSESDRVLFYDSGDGSGALDFDPTTATYPPGSFSSGWTHVAATPLEPGVDCVLFYNANDLSGALCTLTSSSFQTVQPYPAGSFSPWTHVVGLSSGFLFLNSQTGAALVASVAPDVSLVTDNVYPPGSFAIGWTHVVPVDLLDDTLQGFCWPISAAPGGSISFKVSTGAASYTVTYVKFSNADPSGVTAATIANSQELVEVPVTSPIAESGGVQDTNHTPAEGCTDWTTSFALTIPQNWASGIYAAKCVDSRGVTTYIVFVVQPRPDNRAPIAVIANATTWDAYNPWGGYSRYSVPGSGNWQLSYQRPDPWLLDLTNTDPGYHYNSKHQVRGELWVLNWLATAGYTADVYTDLDVHSGAADLTQYRAVILSTHPEYQSTAMQSAYRAYLNRAGHILYLGANGMYDCVEISPDLSQITVHGEYFDRTQLFRNPPISNPEAALLGVEFPWSSINGDIGNRGTRVPYVVDLPAHRFFAGTGLGAGDLIGAQGWCTLESGTSLADGGASGWEIDEIDGNSPPGVQLLATGQNDANMTCYDDPAGGFVFSVGSMSFGGSLIVDATLQRIVRNALDEALSHAIVAVPAAGGANAPRLQLSANVPNPFNPSTRVRFAVAKPGGAVVEILDLQGRRVRDLLRAELPAGPGSVTWDGRNDAGRPLPSGTYLMRLSSGGEVVTRKVTLAK